ncbi:MAG: DUF1302 family protein [Halieaceae bacterium]|jgi:hypothetical protein|nr:DUF1302 family protein [Halieaceae bacterium]
MKNHWNSRAGLIRHRGDYNRKLLAAAIATLTSVSMSAQAFEFNSGNPDLKVRWDNTVKYNLTVRAQDQDRAVIAEGGVLANLADDADLGWEQGDLVNNRFDLLSEMDLVWKDKYGVRVSGAGWYDHAYSGDSKHPGYNKYLLDNGNYADTWGSIAVAPGEFGDDAKFLSYRGAELLDAFVFASFDIGEEMGASVRAGRHTIYWGNSLLLNGAIHGIAGSMTSIDAAKGFAVPGSEAKELFMPTNRISGTLQMSQNLSLVGYYSMEFEPYRQPALATYQSRGEGFTHDNDQFATLIPGQIDPDTLELISPRAGYSKFSDAEPGSGEWGAGVNYYLEDSGWDLGLYYLNYNDKLPQGLNGAMNLGQFASYRADAGGPAFQALINAWPEYNNGVPADPADVFTGGGYPAIGYGSYNWVYKEDVKLFGFSAANEFWGISWGSDFVYRMDAPVNTWLNGQLQHVGNIPPDLPPAVADLVGGTLAANGFSFDGWDVRAQSPSNYPGAVGDTAHIVLNAVGLLSPSALWDGGNYAVETTASTLLDVTENEELLNPNLEEHELSGNIAFNFVPVWYQVMPGLDVKLPLNVAYTYAGDAPPIAFGGTKKFGNASAGFIFEYQGEWRADLKYNYNFGPRDGISGNVKDRGNVSLTVKRTF